METCLLIAMRLLNSNSMIFYNHFSSVFRCPWKAICSQSHRHLQDQHQPQVESSRVRRRQPHHRLHPGEEGIPWVQVDACHIAADPQSGIHCPGPEGRDAVRVQSLGGEQGRSWTVQRRLTVCHRQSQIWSVLFYGHKNIFSITVM